MIRAKGDPPEMDGNVKLVWNFQELTRHDASGDPTKATAEKGYKLRKVLVDYLAGFIKRMDAQNWRYNIKN
jgi:creatinine amidohydrolase